MRLELGSVQDSTRSTNSELRWGNRIEAGPFDVSSMASGTERKPHWALSDQTLADSALLVLSDHWGAA